MMIQGNPTTTEQNQEALRVVTTRFFKGLGDPTRLRLLQLLFDGEKSVGELVAALGLPQNQVSMHLGCLRWCGYVLTRRAGKNIYYSVADGRIRELVELAEALLQGSEVYLMTCGVIGKEEQGLTNVTGWRGCRDRSQTEAERLIEVRP